MGSKGANGACIGVNKSGTHNLRSLDTLCYMLGSSKASLSFSLCHTTDGAAILLVYVHDIIIFGTNLDGIVQLQRVLHASFHTKDLGPLTYFLGLEVHKMEGGIFLIGISIPSDGPGIFVMGADDGQLKSQNHYFAVLLHINNGKRENVFHLNGCDYVKANHIRQIKQQKA